MLQVGSRYVATGGSASGDQVTTPAARNLPLHAIRVILLRRYYAEQADLYAQPDDKFDTLSGTEGVLLQGSTGGMPLYSQPHANRGSADV